MAGGDTDRIKTIMGTFGYINSYCVALKHIPTKNKIQGCSWCLGHPTGEYEFLIEEPRGTSGYYVLDEDENPHIFALLRWIKEYHVDLIDDKRVIHHEELLFLVYKAELTSNPWACRLRVFSVHDQEHQDITFRLVQKMDQPHRH